MHPLHDHVAQQLAEKFKSHKFVVWYDAKSELAPFVAELRGGTARSAEPVPAKLAGIAANLAEYSGSFFDLRNAVEPLARGDDPEPILIYVPGVEHDGRGSVLMELEKAGTVYKPELEAFARAVLARKYTLGQVDEIVNRSNVTYEDVARAASTAPGRDAPSVLQGIFPKAGGTDAILTTWLASDALDGSIDAKEATGELAKLVQARLGLTTASGLSLAKLRAHTLRYLLAGEFRADLKGPPPRSLESVPPPEESKMDALREVAGRLRTSHADDYARLALSVQDELGLASAKLPPESLGSIDTFPFEEQALFAHCGELIATKAFDAALTVVSERESSFWLTRGDDRKVQWEACRRMAELGALAVEVRAALPKAGSDPRAWIDAYTAKEGWFRLDRSQRRLELLVTVLHDTPDERPLNVVRQLYEEVCHAMAEGFTKALVKASWAVPDALHQATIYREVVSSRPRPVAYFLVDAMRYEMGVELADRLAKTSEVSIRPALGVLPSITPIGMAALLPEASSSFSVVEQKDKLGARIDGVFLPDLAARKKFAASRVPHLVDVGLDELLSLQPSKLAKKLEKAQVVIVRSQEIDHAGETGFPFQARAVMDTVIENLARAVRRLANAGVEHSVLSADHGHLFFPEKRDESMHTGSPGGDKVELHRRCWIGRGGATPPGCVRVAASALGYESDLELVFPAGAGVFKAGGDLSFHHGGPSLQELVLPVLTVRLKGRETKRLTSSSSITVTGLPEVVTNRVFSVTLTLDLVAAPLLVRPMLVAAGRLVGAVGMAKDAELDRATGCVTLQPGKPAIVAFLLSDENVPSLRVAVQDPTTDADLYRSPAEIPVKLGV